MDNEPCSEFEDNVQFSFWTILKRYYLLAILVVGGIGLHEELKNNNTYLHYLSKYYLDHPTIPEYFMQHVKNMGHINDTIPEAPNDLNLKDFMTGHVTSYWPAVFRSMLQDQMPAYEKWQDDAYLTKKAGFETVPVSTSRNSEIVPFFHPDYQKPVEMNYFKF